MGKQLIPPEPSDVQEIGLRDALEERYLAYALSTIMHRALPDARDGPQAGAPAADVRHAGAAARAGRRVQENAPASSAT